MESSEAAGRALGGVVSWTKRFLFWTAYRMLVIYWFFRRPQTHGCQVVLLTEQKILLVRHTYKNPDQWDLPGGGIRDDEPPPAAATRELAEELGVSAHDIEHVATTTLYHRFHYDNLEIFVCRGFTGAPSPDRIEITSAEWFPLQDIPANLSPMAAHVLHSIALPRLPETPEGPRAGA